MEVTETYANLVERGGRRRSQEYVDFEKELKDAIGRLNKKRVRDGNRS